MKYYLVSPNGKNRKRVKSFSAAQKLKNTLETFKNHKIVISAK